VTIAEGAAGGRALPLLSRSAARADDRQWQSSRPERQSRGGAFRATVGATESLGRAGRSDFPFVDLRDDSAGRCASMRPPALVDAGRPAAACPARARLSRLWRARPARARRAAGSMLPKARGRLGQIARAADDGRAQHRRSAEGSDRLAGAVCARRSPRAGSPCAAHRANPACCRLRRSGIGWLDLHGSPVALGRRLRGISGSKAIASPDSPGAMPSCRSTAEAVSSPCRPGSRRSAARPRRAR
jgi:hypothetical protein